MSKPSETKALDPSTVLLWSREDVQLWLDSRKLGAYSEQFSHHQIDGLSLLMLTEQDLNETLGIRVLGDLKRMYAAILQLQEDSLDQSDVSCPVSGGTRCSRTFRQTVPSPITRNRLTPGYNNRRNRTYSTDSQADSVDGVSPCRASGDSAQSVPVYDNWRKRGVATNLRPEYLKTIISMLYMLLVTWVTAIIMVFVHDRVPDKNRHPPLPDIFLDNVPHIPWAFQLCEITIVFLSFTWLIILFFHKHRSIMMRRFAALSGSVYLLRCATMFITSLSVPGHHLECAPKVQSDFLMKLNQAWTIWFGGGLSIKGVRTCGDYMFSGHTTALTLLNFFITEYTPRRMYFLHIVSWVLNTFGIFFILAAHEHYSIDVFIAFYITSRMFLYYHSLANNRALQQRDSFRTKIWFPMFSYFEAGIDGIVPNEYVNPLSWVNLCFCVSYCSKKFKQCKVRINEDIGYGRSQTKTH